jgi:hypothetical protein
MKQTLIAPVLGLVVIASLAMAQSPIGTRVSSIVVVDSLQNVVGTVVPQDAQPGISNVVLQFQGAPPMVLQVSSTGFAEGPAKFLYKSTDCSGTPYANTGLVPTGFIWRPTAFGPQAAIYVPTGGPMETFTALSYGGEGTCAPTNKSYTALPFQLLIRLHQVFKPPFSTQVTTY